MSVFQRSLRVSSSSNVIRQQIDLNLCSDIVAPIISWALSWIQITSLSRIFNVKAALWYKMPVKASISTLSTTLTWLYFLLSHQEGLKICLLQVASSCLYIAQYRPSFYLWKKSLNNKDGFFTDLPARWGPGLFCTCSQLLFYGFVRLYLFSIPFLPFSWSQYIQNYAQLVVMHYHNYYHLQYHQEFSTFVSADLLQNFRIHLSSVIWSHLGQIPNFQKIILGQLLSNK